MLQRKMEPAAWEREDVAIALIEQQVSSTAPKCLLEMQCVSGVEQAAPVQGSVPKKGYAGRSSAPSSRALGEEEKKNLNAPVVCFQSFEQGIAGSHQAGTAGPWKSPLRDPPGEHGEETWQIKAKGNVSFSSQFPASKSERGTTTLHQGAIHRLHRSLDQ